MFKIHICYTQKGIQAVSFQVFQNQLEWSFSSEKSDLNLERNVIKWLEDYSQSRQSNVELPFDWSNVPIFTRDVLKIVGTIPFGSLSTYGQIAHLLNHPQAARAVGGACGRNPFLLFIPCHRILDAKMQLRGYSAGGVSVKRKLLLFEKSFI